MRDVGKYRGCMVGLALGDCLGFPVEFCKTMKEIEETYGPGGIKDLPDPALVSDDTQMTMSVARAILGIKPLVGTLEDDATIERYGARVASEFVEWFKSQKDPKNSRAPGLTCMAACQELATGKYWRISGIPESRGSGAAMRSAPIGLWFHEDIPNIVQYGIATAQPTHLDDVSSCASVGTALLCSVAMSGVPVGLWGHELMVVTGGISEDFSRIINAATSAVGTLSPEKALSAGCIGEGWQGHEAVASAMYCCMSCQNDFKAAVLMAANTVGDSDTIACITGALMGARLGIEAIPPEWRGKVEHEKELIGLADGLAVGTP